MLYRADWFWVKTAPANKRMHLADNIFGEEGSLCGKQMPAGGWGLKWEPHWDKEENLVKVSSACRSCVKVFRNLPFKPLGEPE